MVTRRPSTPTLKLEGGTVCVRCLSANGLPRGAHHRVAEPSQPRAERLRPTALVTQGGAELGRAPEGVTTVFGVRWPQLCGMWPRCSPGCQTVGTRRTRSRCLPTCSTPADGR